jgi:hypothetical protein
MIPIFLSPHKNLWVNFEHIDYATETGRGSFPEVTGGRPAVISGVTDGGPPGHPDPKDRVEQGGGRHPPSVTPRNGQAGSLGTEEKTLCPCVRELPHSSEI